MAIHGAGSDSRAQVAALVSQRLRECRSLGRAGGKGPIGPPPTPRGEERPVFGRHERLVLPATFPQSAAILTARLVARAFARAGTAISRGPDGRPARAVAGA